MTVKARIDVGISAVPMIYSRKIFGHFIEHFHRQVCGGLSEPRSHLSNGRGFRLDVIDAMKQLRAPIVRWHGGCPHEWSRLVTESAKLIRYVDEDAVLLMAARADLSGRSWHRTH